MWREITEADVVSTLSRKEVDAFRQSFDEGGTPLADLCRRTAQMVRAYIRAGARVSVSADGDAIPEGLISPACDYLVFDLLKRMPVPVGEDRRRAREQAIALFDDLAAGKVIPESVDAAEVRRSPSFARRRRILD